MQAHQNFTAPLRHRPDAPAGKKARARADDHRALIRRRTDLEAKLLAWRAGWIDLDELRVRKLQRELHAVLTELQTQDALARFLLSG